MHQNMPFWCASHDLLEKSQIFVHFKHLKFVGLDRIFLVVAAILGCCRSKSHSVWVTNVTNQWEAQFIGICVHCLVKARGCNMPTSELNPKLWISLPMGVLFKVTLLCRAYLQEAFHALTNFKQFQVITFEVFWIIDRLKRQRQMVSGLCELLMEWCFFDGKQDWDNGASWTFHKELCQLSFGWLKLQGGIRCS